jgi:3-methyladenine DNA glycosylase Tag
MALKIESFDSIFARAARRKGGAAALEQLLPEPRSARELCAIADRDFLAEMTRKIFQSGFVWKVVDQKWPGFEEVFWRFDPHKLVLASDEQIDRMASDTRIIRHLKKVSSVRHNAQMILDISREYGSFGQFLAQWPESEIVDLWLMLKKRGSRLGGNTGPYFLRFVGKDTFILSRDVCAYLLAHGLLNTQYLL